MEPQLNVVRNPLRYLTSAHLKSSKMRALHWINLRIPEHFSVQKNDERDIALGYRPCVTNDETVTREQANVQSAKKPNRRRSSIRLLSVN